MRLPLAYGTFTIYISVNSTDRNKTHNIGGNKPHLLPALQGYGADLRKLPFNRLPY